MTVQPTYPYIPIYNSPSYIEHLHNTYTHIPQNNNHTVNTQNNQGTTNHTTTMQSTLPFKIATLNVRGLNKPQEQIQATNIMTEHNIQVLGISETKLAPNSITHL